ncbi:hypothetical protein NSPZN2_40094 [Nitrospira defluvii]|uniref:Transposase n=1 Tax=Nitrospira defluvii TaxID=330214 RepID=A0ABM8RQZ7_9BACT|nr:hypothetical protein NSPZN2_40094 [Nitrospira defluvii]
METGLPLPRRRADADGMYSGDRTLEVVGNIPSRLSAQEPMIRNYRLHGPARSLYKNVPTRRHVKIKTSPFMDILELKTTSAHGTTLAEYQP